MNITNNILVYTYDYNNNKIFLLNPIKKRIFFYVELIIMKLN
jgi:hypothetical protein